MSFWHDSRLACARLLRLDLTHSQRHYADRLEQCVTPGIDWLEVGCGRQVVPPWGMPEADQRTLVSRAATLTGIDVDDAIREHPLLTARVVGLGGAFPFRDESFDLVTANMVVEHVDDCRAFLGDVRRVLRPGGRFLFHTPNFHFYLILLASLTPEWAKGRLVWLLERRHESDRFRTFYHLNTQADIARHAADAGFELEQLQFVGSVGSFGLLGPLGILECLPLKAAASLFGGRYNSNLVCTLRKPPRTSQTRG